MAATPIEGVESNARLEALNAIAATRAQQVKEQITDGGGNADLDEAKIGDPGDAPPEPVETAPEEQAQEPQPVKVKIRVDGQDVEVDQDAVIKAGIATLQKETAADKRLEEAARLRKDAELESQRLHAERMQQTQALSQDAPVQPDQYAEVARKIQYGSEAEASEAIKALVTHASTSGQSQAVTMQQVADFIEFRDATRWASEQYADLLGDPIMRGAFAQREREIRTAGDSRPYRDIYGQIGTELREWLHQKAPSAQPAQTREERKARVVTIPSAASRQATPNEPKEPTPSEIVEQIRQARLRR
jgi:hypothetical protein